MENIENKREIGPRILRYAVPKGEIAADMGIIVQIGRAFMTAQSPADLVAMARIQTSRMREQSSVPLEYDLPEHVSLAVKNLVTQGEGEGVDALRIPALALTFHDGGKVNAPNGDHPKASTDYANAILEVLEREGFIRPQDSALVARLVRWHHGLGDVVLGRDGVTKSDIQRTFSTPLDQSAFVGVVRADMSTWVQGRVWWRESIAPALPRILPDAVIYSNNNNFPPEKMAGG